MIYGVHTYIHTFCFSGCVVSSTYVSLSNFFQIRRDTDDGGDDLMLFIFLPATFISYESVCTTSG